MTESWLGPDPFADTSETTSKEQTPSAKAATPHQTTDTSWLGPDPFAGQDVSDTQDLSKYETPYQESLTAAEGAFKGLTAGFGPGIESNILEGAQTKPGVGPGFTAEDIRGRAAANPWISNISEYGSMGASLLGGVGEMGAVAKGLDAVAGLAPTALVGKLGGLVAEGVGGKIGSQAIGRIIGATAAGGIENSLFSVGNQYSLDTLDHNPVTADKLWAAAQGGFLPGAALGGGIGLGVEAITPLLRKAAPYLGQMADRLRAGGLSIPESEIRKLSREELSDLSDVAKKYDIDSPMKALDARTKIETKIDELHDQSRVTLDGEDVRQSLKSADPEVRKQIDNDFLGPEERTVPRTKEEIEEYLTKNPELRPRFVEEQTKGVGGFASQDVLYKPAPPENLSISQADQLVKVLRDNDELKAAKAVESLRQSAIRDVPKSLDEVDAQAYKQLQTEQKAADYLAQKINTAEPKGGVLGYAAAGALLGHGPGAVGGIATKLIKDSPAAKRIGADWLDKVAHADILARASRAVDKDLKHGVSVASGRAQPVIRPNKFRGPADTSPVAEKTGFAHLFTNQPKVTVEAVDKLIPGLSVQAPRTAARLADRINTVGQYIQSQMPRALNGPSLLDPTAKPRYDEVEAEKFFETVRATQDPVGTLNKAFESGYIGQHEVDAIKVAVPELYKELQGHVLQELAHPDVGGKIPPNSALVIGKLFGVAPDPIYSAPVKAAMEVSYQPVNEPATPGSAHSMPGNNLSKVNVVKNLLPPKLPLNQAAK